MPGQVSPLPLPPQGDVEVSVKIRTPLQITSHVARQKANRQIALHCGQSFSLDEPELYVSETMHWRVPVWVTHPAKGRVARLGELRVDAETGEVLATHEELRMLRAAANGVLQSCGETTDEPGAESSPPPPDEP
jgi:hypothetical protein